MKSKIYQVTKTIKIILHKILKLKSTTIIKNFKKDKNSFV